MVHCCQKQMLHAEQQFTRLAKQKQALSMQSLDHAYTLRSVVVGG